MDALRLLIEEISSHCDLAERLLRVPAEAQVRGFYFQSIETVLACEGQLERYRTFFPAQRASVLWYPAADFLLRLVAGAALLRGPARVHEGMFEIGRRNAVVFTKSLFGKLLLRLLAREPKRLLAQGMLGRRHSMSYGRWSLTFLDERAALMRMVDEYMYIESYLLGAAHGTFEAVALPVRVEVELEDPYSGLHALSW